MYTPIYKHALFLPFRWNIPSIYTEPTDTVDMQIEIMSRHTPSDFSERNAPLGTRAAGTQIIWIQLVRIRQIR